VSTLWSSIHCTDRTLRPLKVEASTTMTASHSSFIEVPSTVYSITQSAISPCDHEEADTRLFLHALHCAQSGYRKVLIRSVDTDVVV